MKCSSLQRSFALAAMLMIVAAATTHAAVTLIATPNPPFVTNAVIDVGQITVFNTLVSNGIAPYTGNWFWSTVNTISLSNTPMELITSSNELILTTTAANTLTMTFNGPSYTVSTGTTNTIYGIWHVGASFIDNTGNTVTTSTNTVTINPALLETAWTASNSPAFLNDYQTLSASISGGTSSYTYNFLVYNSVGDLVTNALFTGVSSTSNSFSFQIPTSYGEGTFTANIIVKDSATTAVQVTNSLAFSINNNNLYSATVKYTRYIPSGGSTSTTSNTDASYQAGYYDIPVIAFNGIGTVNGQSPWKVYLNGQLVATTNALYNWSEQGQPGVYSFTFDNPGNANYSAYTIKTTVTVSALPSGGSAASNIATTVSTTTTKTTATTTIPPTTTIKQYNASLPGAGQNVSLIGNGNVNLTFNDTGIRINILSTIGGQQHGVAVITNQTTNSSLPQMPNNTLLGAFDFNTTLSSVNVTMTVPFPCSNQAAGVAPYILKNGTWEAITPFNVNSTSCTVSFTVPKDPIIGVFSQAPSTAPTTVQQITTGTQGTGGGTDWTLYILIVIVVILAAGYYYYYGRKSKRR